MQSSDLWQLVPPLQGSLGYPYNLTDDLRHFRTRYLLFELLIQATEATETVGKTGEIRDFGVAQFLRNVVRKLGAPHYVQAKFLFGMRCETASLALAFLD